MFSFFRRKKKQETQALEEASSGNRSKSRI